MKKTQAKPKINVKKLIIISVAALLLVGAGFGVFFAIDYALIDTEYDLVHLPDYIQIPKYFGMELSTSEIDKQLADSKDALIDNFTIKNPVKKGTLTQGMNVTVSVTAKLEGATVSEVSYSSYEITDIGNHTSTKDQAFFEALEDWLLEKVTKIDFEDATYTNAAPNFKYTYPDDYSVTKVKGKEVTHVIFITAVTASVKPEYNDEFFVKNKDAIISFLGVNIEFNSVQAFEAYMRHQIEINTLWNRLIDGSKVKKYPKSFVKDYEDEFDEYYEMIMEQEGITRAQLLSQLGTDENGYKDGRSEYAQGIVKEEMVLYEIIEAENIRLSSSEYKKMAKQLAQEGGYGTVENLEEALGKDRAERTVIWEKVKELILSKAVRVD